MNEPFSVESDSNYSLHLYTEVKNCKSLRAQIHSSSLNYCFVEAKHVLDIVLVHVAASKALYSLSYNELVTKNVYSEMLYSLSTVKDVLFHYLFIYILYFNSFIYLFIDSFYILN